VFQDGSVRAFVVSLGFGSQGVMEGWYYSKTVVLCWGNITSVSSILVPIPAVVQHRLELGVELRCYTGCVNGSRGESFTLASPELTSGSSSRADGLIGGVRVGWGCVR
jgi:hypothetical protein